MSGQKFSFQNEIVRSNKRLKVGVDVEYRAEQAREARVMREARQRARRLKQEQEDRERYIIPEYLDLDEQLISHL
jgi:hypothetical protein